VKALAGRGRFRLLKLAIAGVGLLLAARVVQVQVFLHDEYERRALIQWSSEIKLQAERGNLFDRAGRPLALSVTTWRVGVATSLVEDRTGVAACLADILETGPKDLERRIRRADGSHIVLGAEVVLTRNEKIRLQKFKSVTLNQTSSRIYPQDGVGSSLVGFHKTYQDEEVSTGLEYGLGNCLAGREGRARLIETARVGQNLGQVIIEEPVHGQSVVLSVDSELQAICDARLRQAVADCGAVGGSVLILAPGTGDILAAASWPMTDTRRGSHPDPAVWQNRNFTYLYEPGSTFKVFSAASMLRNGAIDTATVFDCSNHQFDGYRIYNDGKHKYGDLPFMRAFAKSSNIYFARAVCNLSDQELYRDLLDFGFGQTTNLPYPGQPRGILHSPETWSKRSKSTLSFGQEIAATPLQVGLAMCAVGNGGTLFAPRLVQEIQDQDGRVLERYPPVPMRRVMAEPLADLLLAAMGRTVLEGTGKAARMDWITSGGKTGTAQKSVDGKGFTPGAYIASFAGLVPLEQPRLMVLTILDQPKGIKHYAAESAVPLFAEILRDIRQSTDWLTDVPGARTAPMVLPEADRMVQVPDVMYLSVPNAAQRLGAAGFTLAGAEKDGLVVQQIPAAGTHCSAGGQVQLTVAGRTGTGAEEGTLCPDFTGLSNRQVRGLSARLGIDVQIKGAGYVSRQSLDAGRSVSGRTVVVRMESPWR